MQLPQEENGSLSTLPQTRPLSASSKTLPRQLGKSYSSSGFTPNATVKFGSGADQPGFYFKG
jgi:hypothetical protein